MKDIGHWISGKRVAGASGRYGDIFNPSVGEQSGRVAFASAAEVDAAVQAAQEALPKWAATTPLRRARIMFRLKDLLEQHIDELADLVSSEHGKTLADAKGEVVRGIEVVEFACGIRSCSRASSARTSAPASISCRSASRSGCAPASRRSISRR